MGDRITPDGTAFDKVFQRLWSTEPISALRLFNSPGSFRRENRPHGAEL